jgi:glyoxylase-like metal-dependent hydrolase (beta-lactamase superfamily II)
MRFLFILLLGPTLVWSAPDLEPVAVAPSVYAFYGDPGEATPDNAGNTGNSGFIIGSDGVIVVDTGISYRHGQAMLAAIARTTRKPVQLVIVTHGVQEFLFGNAAFAERGVPLLAHTRSVELMRSRCEHCLENLRQLLGEEQMHSTRVVLPERTLEASTSLEVAGRKLICSRSAGRQPGDLANSDRSGVLFTGGLLTVRILTARRQADGWPRRSIG